MNYIITKYLYKMSSFSNSNSSNSNTTKKVIEFADWNPKATKYMAPKINDKGGKSIMLISEQTKRALHLNTPLLMTWGISDFCDEQGNSDGKYKMSLNFPNPEYKTKDSDEFLKKMLEFQEQLLDDAVANSELWWGETMSRELVKHTFFPFLKYPKDKNTKKTDYTRAPSMNVKVPFYGEKWDVELYDTKYNQIFPCDDSSLTPVDFVPKLSKVASTIQCTGVWIGGKGWGLTWKLIQSVVKPKESEDIRGKCQIKLSEDDKKTIESQVVDLEDPDVDDIPAPTPIKAIETVVEDSDDDEPVKQVTPPPPQVETPVEPPKVVKKIVKKKVAA
jgi:hypothetical protein